MSWECEHGEEAAMLSPPPSDIIEGPVDFNDLIIENTEATFAVRIAGDSMRGIGIHPNDIAVINRAREATDGCIVLAILNNAFTIKRFRKTKSGIRLEAANPKYPDIEIRDGDDFEIWGVVSRSIRVLM